MIFDFPINETFKRLVRHARESQEHEPTFAQAYDPSFHKGGKIRNTRHGYPDPKNVDMRKIPPALWIVKDHGVYLMSNGHPRMAIDDPQNPHVLYAKGRNPSDPDWYVPGDDFVEALDLDWIEQQMDAEDIDTFRVEVTETKVRMSVLRSAAPSPHDGVPTP